MNKCPRCNEPLPVLSKVCPRCGTVVNSEGAVDLVNSLEMFLHELRGIQVPGFSSGMAKMSVFVVPIISIFFLVVALISSAGLFWILFVLSLVWSIWLIIKKIKGTFQADIAKKEFIKYRNGYETALRKARLDYGKDPEVKRVLADIESEIHDIEDRWTAAMRKNLFIWLGILVIVILLSTTGVFSVSSVVEENTSTEVSGNKGWQEMINDYRSSSEIEQNDPAILLNIIKKVLESGAVVEAEVFFVSDIMGKIGDTDCAKEIIKAYINNNQIDKARTFVSKCSSLRYASDKKSLEKLVN